MFIENPIGSLKAIVATTAPNESITPTLLDYYSLTHPCQGDESIVYQIMAAEYRLPRQKIPIDPEDYDLPLFIIILNQPRLGQAIHALNDIRRSKEAAEEMTDPLCQKAECKNGADCILKRLKNKS